MAASAAVESYAFTAATTARTIEQVRAIWGDLDPAALSASWAENAVGDRLFQALTMAEYAVASGADYYTDQILAETGGAPDPDGRINPQAFSGVASDGRPLADLLLQPLIRSSIATAAGASPIDALSTGLSSLTRIVSTQIPDLGRSASGVTVASRQRTGWIRLVSPGACARCAILAGRWYRWSDHFLRHPGCHCRNIPASEDTPELTAESDPMTLFRSLSEADQNRQFSKAGAQAIRDGADISRVVNARRGALGLTSPGRLTLAEQKATRGGRDKFGHLDRVDVYGRPVYTTSEATTVRSSWGKAEVAKFGGGKKGRYQVATTPRLMPESIYEIATDREDAVRLLKRFGYIL